MQSTFKKKKRVRRQIKNNIGEQACCWEDFPDCTLEACMKIHEYQAKTLLREAGVAIPRGLPALSVDEAVAAAAELGGSTWVVKAQIHAGGRGKAGGIKIARSLDEVRQAASEILGMVIVNRQTGPQGKKVERLYVEQGADIAAELYAAVLVDRVTQTVCLMASAMGGVEIEEVAKEHPEAIVMLFIDPVKGLSREALTAMAKTLGSAGDLIEAAADFLQKLYEAFVKYDASLLETNPMAVLRDGTIVALDAKMSLDDNALYRHPGLEGLRDFSEEDPFETQAKSAGLSYIALDGDIACMVNGAGLAMATMDTIKLYGAEPANFLDVGGGASVEKVTAAFEIMLSNPKVKAILINIFGGIMRCDTIAEGVVAACHAVKLSVPLVVRMNGTNEETGRRILKESGLSIIPAASMSEAAQKVIEASRTAGAKA